MSSHVKFRTRLDITSKKIKLNEKYYKNLNEVGKSGTAVPGLTCHIKGNRPKTCPAVNSTLSTA